jgi:hypothetical protein
MRRRDSLGEALESNGKPIPEGPSMITRLLASEPGPGRRQLLRDEEEPYTFVESLVAGKDPRHFGLPWPGLKPAADEIVLKSGWKIRVIAPRSPQVETAVDDLRKFLAERMKIKTKIIWGGSDSGTLRSIIVSQGPNLPKGPRRPAGYRFIARDKHVHIHGFDGRGVLRG